jgi:hypothetical protein
MQQDHPKPPEATAVATATALPSSDSGGFVKVEGGGKEQTSAEGTLILAYLLIWAIMIFFLSRILRGQKAMQLLAQRILDSAGGLTNDRK